MATASAASDAAPALLQLDVKINGFPLKLIGSFTQHADGHLESTRSELTSLGIVVPGSGPEDESVALSTIPGLTYVYDEPTQSIDLKLPASTQIAKDILAHAPRSYDKAETGTGLVLNYTAFAAGEYQRSGNIASINGANLSLDARAYSKYGTFRQSGIVGTTTFSEMTALRLDSTWTYSDQDKMRTYRLGDIISGGLRWTRPIRLGGGQVQRNFSLRPDLITMPLPNFSGSAAVPSTLDVYIGDTKAYSTGVDPGRFNINDIPVYTNAGRARMVLTDSTGRSVESETDFQTSPDLLKRNLYDYSLDMGVVRRNFGTDSFGYDDQPVALGSLRYGLSNWVTSEAHIEAKYDLIDAGLGALVSGGKLGLFNGAVAASKFEDKEGLFFHAGWDKSFKNISFSASTSRTLGDYNDLAAATEQIQTGSLSRASVPRALDQVSIGYSIPSTQSGLGVSFVHQLKDGSDEAFLVSGSFSQQLSHNISLFLNGYADLGRSGDRGVYFGLSMPLGGERNLTTAVSEDKTGPTVSAEVTKPMGEAVGDYGWHVGTSQSSSNLSVAGGSYRTGKGVLTGNIAAHGTESAQGNIAYTGSAILTDGSVFASDHVNDSFAVVDAGAPGVKVNYENRYVGTTGKDGKLLLPGLHSYLKNRIAIDPNDLPMGATTQVADTVVVPAESAGLKVNFGVKKDAGGVLVTLTDSNGKFLTEGAEVQLNDSKDSFFVGYDGQVYVTGASLKNTLLVNLAKGTCQASFDYAAKPAEQATIGPLICR